MEGTKFDSVNGLARFGSKREMAGRKCLIPSRRQGLKGQTEAFSQDSNSS